MNKFLCVSALFILAMNANAADNKPGAVKKSASGVCHASESRFYAKLKHFTSYDSLKACIDSGGKMPGTKPKK